MKNQKYDERKNQIEGKLDIGKRTDPCFKPFVHPMRKLRIETGSLEVAYFSRDH